MIVELTALGALHGKLAEGIDSMVTFRKHRGEQCTKAPDIAGWFEHACALTSLLKRRRRHRREVEEHGVAQALAELRPATNPGDDVVEAHSLKATAMNGRCGDVVRQNKSGRIEVKFQTDELPKHENLKPAKQWSESNPGRSANDLWWGELK